MNKFSSRILGLIACILLITSSGQKAKAQEVVVSYQTFYDELSPYGQWVEDAEYGNVWVPNAESGFRPYATNGHWVMTEAGNMWVSDEPYGWATFHYGRWTYNSYYGWVWVPGHEWAPAWVSWRSGGGYYGWAPMAPNYVIGATYDYPDDYWVFVGPEYLYEPNVYTYYRPHHTRRYIRQSSYINETYVDNGYHSTYYYGPRREMIERETHRPVQVYQVSNARSHTESRVSGSVVQVYRPAVNRDSRQTARPANSVRGYQPVGRPQEYSNSDARRQSEFRQTMQRQNGGANTGQGNQPQNDNRQQRPANYYDHRGDNRLPTRTPPPEPQRFNEPNNSRQQPQQRQPARIEPQPQSPQPQQQQRFQPQPQQRQQSQPQPQQRPQQAQPQPQPRPQPQQQPERGKPHENEKNKRF